MTSIVALTELTSDSGAASTSEVASVITPEFVLHANARFLIPPSATHSPQRRLMPWAFADVAARISSAIR